MSDQSMSARLRNLAPSLDDLQQQTRRPPHPVSDNADLNARLAERADRPTAALDRMMDNAKSMIDTLKEQREVLESMRDVQQKAADARYEREQAEDAASLERLEVAMSETRKAMAERTVDHRARCKKIDSEIDAQVAAVDKMISAQRGVIDAGKPAEEAKPAKRGKKDEEDIPY